MAPALVPLIPAISKQRSSNSRSSTPHVKAQREPPPCSARAIGWLLGQSVFLGFDICCMTISGLASSATDALSRGAIGRRSR